jgi:hypothetical protein
MEGEQMQTCQHPECTAKVAVSIKVGRDLEAWCLIHAVERLQQDPRWVALSSS